MIPLVGGKINHFENFYKNFQNIFSLDWNQILINSWCREPANDWTNLNKKYAANIYIQKKSWEK